jgi:hypothetical protein
LKSVAQPQNISAMPRAAILWRCCFSIVILMAARVRAFVDSIALAFGDQAVAGV